MRNRRSYNRFDVHIVGEFRSLSNPAASFLGITRDFSCGGFSFESQLSDLTPGDTLALKFKHPDHDLIVATQGEIVWKRETEKFICLMGIKFRDVSDSFKNKMLNMLAAVGEAPVNFIPSITDKVNEIISTAETGQASNIGKVHTEAVRGSNTALLILISVTAAAVMFLSLPARLDNLINRVTTSNENSVDPRSVQENINYHPGPLSEHDPLDRPVKDTSYKPSQGTGIAAPVRDITEQRVLSPMDNEADDNSAFIIQVGSWKNPDYARETLDHLIELFPDTYMVIEKGFHVIRIPGLATKTDGDRIIKELEDKYNLRPLLVLNRK